MTQEVFPEDVGGAEGIGSDEIPYGRKEPETYREIVIQQIGECRRQLSRYLVEGGLYYVKEKGQFIPKNIEDQWEINQRCVEQLYDLLLFYFDKEAKENFTALFSKEEADRTALINEYLEYERDPRVKDIIRKTNELVYRGDDPIGKSVEKRMYKLRDRYTRLKYRELILLFKRKNDLSKTREIGPY